MSDYYKRRKRERKHPRPNRRTEHDANSPERIRHPPHLRGKEIGLFYARLNKERRRLNPEGYRKTRRDKPLGTILLSETKKQEIRNLLSSTTYFDLDDDINFTFRDNFKRLIEGKIEDKLNSINTIEQNTHIDETLFKDIQEKQNNPTYRQMLKKRKLLPSYAKKEEILKLVDDNQVVVVSGETGCGKTTQVAQFILDDFIEKKKGSLCRIICTQPRRISAITVAERVAVERAERLGLSVGYQIRLEKQLPRSEGFVMYCTTGVVLRQMQNDPCLSNISHIILDEIHERDVPSDFLITLLKQVLSKRTDLKVILMSATLNAEKFSSYYNNCPHVNIPGFTYPVRELYLEDVLERTGFRFDDFYKTKCRLSAEEKNFYSEMMEPHVRKLESEKAYSRNVCIQLRNPQSEELNLDLVLALLIDICQKEKDPGAILVFLTGYAEISKLNQLIEQCGKFPRNKYLVLGIHSRMPTVNQKQIFDRPPTGVRKIVLSTNITETSITIDDIVFVIDCGKIKMSNFDVKTNTQTLKAEWVTLANTNQRRGRAGRVQPGMCFHLFSRARLMVLEQYQKPEILRTRLENTILNIKILQLGKVEVFLNRLMDSPEQDAMLLSLELLKRLNALDENETLTPLGYHLASLPMAPQVGKMILLGAMFSCLDPVLSVAVSLDFKDAFQKPLGKEKEADEKKYELSKGWLSDHLTFFEALDRFESKDQYSAKEFCWRYFLSANILTQLCSMKVQFMEYLRELDFVNATDPKSEHFNRNSHNLSLVKAVICGGLYPNVGIITKRIRGGRPYTADGERVDFHPSSVLCNEQNITYPMFVYFLKLKTSSSFIHDATLVHPLPIIFFGDNYKYNSEEEHKTVSIGHDPLKFKCSQSTYEIIKVLRDRLNLFLEYKVSNPGIVNWQADEEETAVLRAIIELITSEDIGDLELSAFEDFE